MWKYFLLFSLPWRATCLGEVVRGEEAAEGPDGRLEDARSTAQVLETAFQVAAQTGGGVEKETSKHFEINKTRS